MAAQDQDIADYKPSMIEPLHDFKNNINRVLRALPYAAGDKPKLRTKINNALAALNGEHKMCLLARRKSEYALVFL